MSLADIREQIKVVVQGIEGVGVVHDRERWSNDWGKFLDFYKDTETGRIRGCVFARKSMAKRWATAGGREKAHIFMVRFVWGFNDAEETGIQFDNFLEAAEQAFNAADDDALEETCLSTSPDWGPMEGACGLQIDDVDVRMFGNVLCHYAECRLCVLESV